MNINIFKLEDYLGKYEFSAKYLLCCSDAESFEISEILSYASNEDKKLWDNLSLGYTEVEGLPLLRDVIAKNLYNGIDPNNILMFAGAEEGIFCGLYSLINNEDHVIVLTPCYQSLIEIPRLKNAEITEIKLVESNKWRIDLEIIKNSIKSNTKCIITNFPHNPTGQIIEQSELDSLIEICKSKNIWIFSDEVYRLLGEPNNKWVDPVACLYDHGISLGVMSKAFGMAGLRIGWIACQNKLILSQIKQFKHYTSICNSAPSEILSLIALKNKDIILERNNKIVKKNLEILEQFFKDYSDLFEWVKPQGGCVGFVKYKSSENIDDFCRKLVEDKNVLLMPASLYDFEGNYFRIGFGRKNMPECLEKFKEFLNENYKK